MNTDKTNINQIDENFFNFLEVNSTKTKPKPSKQQIKAIRYSYFKRSIKNKKARSV
jgi:hypothetical protein